MYFEDIIEKNFSHTEHVYFAGQVRGHYTRKLATNVDDWAFIRLWNQSVTLTEEVAWDAVQVPYEPGLNAQT